MPVVTFRAVGSSPGVGRLIDQSDDAAKGSEIEVCGACRSFRAKRGKKKFAFISSYQDAMGSRGTFVLLKTRKRRFQTIGSH